jgi:hypothetical protein
MNTLIAIKDAGNMVRRMVDVMEIASQRADIQPEICN